MPALLYITAHKYKHYEGSATGLRSLLDTYVYLSKQPLDMAYAAVGSRKMGIQDFEGKNRLLSLHLSPGTYGTIQRRAENKMRKNGSSKLRYILERFSVLFSRKNKNYTSFAGMYPFFYKHRIMLPILPLCRTAGRFQREAQAIRDPEE